MKQLVCAILLGFTQVGCCEPDARVTLRVTDDAGRVVSNAWVTVSTFDHWKPGEFAGKDVLREKQKQTDAHGLATLTIPCKTGSVQYGIYAGKYSTGGYAYQMNGVRYYNGGGGEYFSTNAIMGKWQPWDPHLEINIKRVCNPIPMYAKHVNSGLNLLHLGDKLAYDLIKGDWVKPYGKGETADFIFSGVYNVIGKSRYNKDYFDMTLDMTFSNEDDGIQCVRVPPQAGSVLRLPYCAPADGYEPILSQEKYVRNDLENKQTLDEDLNYFFRVRTEKNDKGEIISALYGKIYKPVEFWVSPTKVSIQFTYYVNPSPNDLNLEYDPNENLFDKKQFRGMAP